MAHEGLSGHYIIEQMGHKRIAGYVQEVVIAGKGFLQVSIPGGGSRGQDREARRVRV